MVSCNNDNTDFIEQKAPVAQTQQIQTQPKEEAVEFDGYLYFIADATQLEIFNNIYNVKAGGESFEVNLEKLDETSLKPAKQADKIDSYRAALGDQPLKIFRFKIPAVVKDIKDVSVTTNFSLKDGAQVPDSYVSFAGVCDTTGRGIFSRSIKIHADKTDAYLAAVNVFAYNFGE